MSLGLSLKWNFHYFAPPFIIQIISIFAFSKIVEDAEKVIVLVCCVVQSCAFGNSIKRGVDDLSKWILN